MGVVESLFRSRVPSTSQGGEVSYVIAIRPVNSIQPSECVDDARVLSLVASIRRDGCWLQPVPIDRASGLVMDGNHRLRVAHLLGLRHMPCVPLSYDDPRVAVHCWRTGAPFDLRVLFAALGRQELLPFKSTRHRFAPALPSTEVRLDLLM